MNDRYSRQEAFFGTGQEGQEKLLSSRICIVGLGALGTVTANNLARAGVGFIRVIDRDYVELSNLQRQVIYTEKDAAEALPKAEAARRHLEEANSGIEIEAMITEDSYNQNLRKRCQRVVRQIRNNKDLDDDSKRVVENMPTNNHAFRVAFNSRLIDLGLSARERASILGHAVETKKRFYSKRDERTHESIASRLVRAHLDSSLAAKDRSAQKDVPVDVLLV